MAATAPRNLVQERRAVAAAPVAHRPATSSDVPLDATGPGIETALGYFLDPSVPVVGGIIAGALGGLAAAGVGLLLMLGSVYHDALNAIAPLAVLIGVLLVGTAGGLGGLLVLLAAQRRRPAVRQEAPGEPVLNEPAAQA
jgi:hypothetical protein